MSLLPITAVKVYFPVSPTAIESIVPDLLAMALFSLIVTLDTSTVPVLLTSYVTLTSCPFWAVVGTIVRLTSITGSAPEYWIFLEKFLVLLTSVLFPASSTSSLYTAYLILKVIFPASSSFWVTVQSPDQFLLAPAASVGEPNSSTFLPLG